MDLRVAIVGPGRVGSAFGRRLADKGFELIGFLGRSPGAAAAAVDFARSGRVLTGYAELADAEVVVLSVGDLDLPQVAADAAADSGAMTPGSLWFHTSGRHDLDVLSPLAKAGALTGSLHPVCPMADPTLGMANLRGRAAVVQGHDESRDRLSRPGRTGSRSRRPAPTRRKNENRNRSSKPSRIGSRSR